MLAGAGKQGDSVMDSTAKLTRRGLMGLGGGLALTFAGGGVAAAAARKSAAAATSVWSRASYSSLVGASFYIRGYRSVQLLGIEDLAGRPPGSDGAFLLRFRTSGGAGPLPEGLPSLYHPALGSFPMFLVPAKVQAGAKRNFLAVIDHTHG
jgi:hypothetical protein